MKMIATIRQTLLGLDLKKLICCLMALSPFMAVAETKPYKIELTLSGRNIPKYVYVANNEHDQIQKVKITSNKLSLAGTYNTKQRLNEMPFLILMLSKDSVFIEDHLSGNQKLNCRLFPSENILVEFNADNQLFTVDGDHENKIMNQFIQIKTSLRNKRDSMLALTEPTDRAKIFEIKRVAMIEENNALAQIIRANSDSEVALFHSSPYNNSSLTTAKEVLDLHNSFSKRLQNSAYGLYLYKAIDAKVKKEYYTINPKYIVGASIPKFELPDNTGKVFSSSQLKKQYTLIDFWATWCPPCREETPNLIAAYKKYKSDFDLVAITIDGARSHKEWLEMIKTDGMTDFINLFNDNGYAGIAGEMNINAIPANYLIDNNGKIVAMNLRGDELMKKLGELLGK